MTSASQSPNLPAPVINWPALISAFAKASADLRANQVRAPGPVLTGAKIAAALPAIQADIALFATKVQAYPGAITAADDILSALEADGEPWASEIRAAIDALPGGLAMVEQYIPMAIGLFATFSPAPDPQIVTGGPSPFHGR